MSNDAAALAMGILEYWLGSSRLRLDPKARAIAFQFIGDADQVYVMDPRRDGRLFAAEARNDVATRVVTSPGRLLMLLLEPGTPAPPREELDIIGDTAPVRALIEALRGQHSSISLRASAPSAHQKKRRRGRRERR